MICKMYKTNKNQDKILKILLKQDKLQSSVIHQKLLDNEESVSLVTVKRELSELTANDLIAQSGGGRYINYSINTPGRVYSNINPLQYSLQEPDRRYGMDKFNQDLFVSFPNKIFTDQENEAFKESTHSFIANGKNLSPLATKKELERLVIELSWKSSKIEGNTYTLLDTEKLIRENQEATGHPKQEATMILNHKKAFNYILENKHQFKILSKKNLEEVHSILTKGLGITKGYRKGLVGITGSKYTPIDNLYQITEAVEDLFDLINKTKNPYTKALLVLAGVSYIQPFEDGNKRTSRLITNAVLLTNNLAPLSYRSVDEKEYRAAMLVFYELNSITAIKKIFKEQYLAATSHYSLGLD